MKNNPSVHIILLNYNGYKDTIDCIKSLQSIEYPNYKIVVVDNKSTNESEKHIKEFIKENKFVHFIQTGKNLGFSGGNNVGIEWSLKNGADYICLLNNDTTVEPDFLNSLIDEMENNKNIGISAGKIMYYSKPDIIWSAGGYIDESKCLGYHYGINCKDSQEYNIKKEVTFLTGCLQLIKKDVIKDIGLYDDSYFLYMEDVDFCYRAKLKGYKIMYIPESKIYHKVSASTGGEQSPMVLYYMTRNVMLFNKKFKDTLKNNTKFNIYWKLKMIVDRFRRKDKYKYIEEGLKDHKIGKYGCKVFEFK